MAVDQLPVAELKGELSRRTAGEQATRAICCRNVNWFAVITQRELKTADSTSRFRDCIESRQDGFSGFQVPVEADKNRAHLSGGSSQRHSFSRQNRSGIVEF